MSALRRSAVVLGAVVLCAWCGWVSGFHRSTLGAEVTWLVSLGAVVATDALLWRGRRGLRPGWRLEPVPRPWPRPGRGGGRRALAGVAPWLVLVVVALAWDILGLDTPPDQYHLTISALSQAYRPLNAGLLLLWILVGVGYEAARVRAPVDREGAPLASDTGRAAPESTLAAAGALEPHAAGATPGLLLPEHPAIGVAFWVVLPIAALAIHLVARRSKGRLADAEEFVRFISTSRLAHVVLVVAWAYAGYHLFAR